MCFSKFLTEFAKNLGSADPRQGFRKPRLHSSLWRDNMVLWFVKLHLKQQLTQKLTNINCSEQQYSGEDEIVVISKYGVLRTRA